MKNLQKWFKLSHSQSGDTIVEVVLALTVLALVLGTSSVLANRNTRTLQTSQENTYALRVAQAQLEYIKSYVATNASSMPSAPNSKFCMVNATTKQVDLSSTSCKKQSGGADYNVSLETSPIGTDGYNVTARVQWDTLTGSPGNVELTYKVYKKLGANEPAGEGDTCPAGTSGTVPDCVPNTPSIKVTVSKIAPNAGDTTPDCSKAATQTRAGTTVRLSGPTVKQQTTGGDSSTLFTGLEPFGYYQAQVNGVPSGFQVCPPSTSSLTQARHDSVANLQFKIRPICYQETRYTAPYHHYSASYDHYSAPYHHYTAPYDHGYWQGYWAHSSNPDYSPDGYYPTSMGGSFYVNDSTYYTWDRYSNLYPGYSWYLGWSLLYGWVSTGYYADYLGYYSDYLGYYADYLGYYSDPYTANVCPS